MTDQTDSAAEGTRLVKRESLSEDDLAQALEHCASEPIHTPNAIQPHGFMLVTTVDSNKVCYSSASVNEFLPHAPSPLIGSDISVILNHADLSYLADTSTEDNVSYQYLSVTLNGKKFDAISHAYKGFRFFEFEPQKSVDEQGHRSVTEIREQLRQFSVASENAESFDELYALVVTFTKKITQFDRVKLYKFDEQWNGAVVEEAREEFMPSYRGLCFPASDIPEQARRLYSINYLRLIADIRYQPSSLKAAPEFGQTPLDMSHCVLRSVSPIHIQYLDNINVQASMSVSIMVGGNLWGLIACHHAAPHFVSYDTRVLSEIISHIFSARITTLESRLSKQRAEFRKTLFNKLSSPDRPMHASALISEHNNSALNALKSDGFILASGEKIEQYNCELDNQALKELVRWYRTFKVNSVFHTTDVAKLIDSVKHIKKISGGVLIAPVGQLGQELAIWYRKARVEQVNWAGNPEKPVTETKAGYRLTPRSSFALWQEEVEGNCEKWQLADIETAESITQLLLENEKIRAQSANDAKTAFLSQMSHELRTPLGSIIAIAQILNRDSGLTDRQNNLISSLRISADSLHELINDLLDISKIEAQELTLSKEVFSFRDILEEVRSVMSVKGIEKGVSLIVHYDHVADMEFLADCHRLKQVIINLVGNALKFTERGSVNVFVNREAIEHSPDYSMVTIEVMDTGIGIPEEKIDTIFEKFQQADDTISRSYGGSGLGLAISKSLVELMGGTISVASRVGLGTNFTVRVPLRHEEQKLTKASEASEPITQVNENLTHSAKVLLVEDYDGNIIAMLDYLQNEKCEVIVARNGHAAVEQVKKSSFDLIIMDVQMPGMDGLSATRIIKEMQAKGEMRSTPILGMTANVFKEDRDRCFAAGMDEYISKPVKLTELATKMNHLLSKSNGPDTKCN